MSHESRGLDEPVSSSQHVRESTAEYQAQPYMTIESHEEHHQGEGKINIHRNRERKGVKNKKNLYLLI